MDARATLLPLALAALSCSGGPHHGPYWQHEKVTPPFTIQQDTLSTAFTGHVWPDQTFIFGPADGVAFTTPNIRLTLDAAAVWAYAPVTVELYDGEQTDVGAEEHLVARWVVNEPLPDGDILFQGSQVPLRPPNWVRIHFEDFSGQCVFQLLGHH